MDKKQIKEYLKEVTLSNSVQIVGSLITPGDRQIGKYFEIEVRDFVKIRSNTVAWIDDSEALVGEKSDIISYLSDQKRPPLPISYKYTEYSPVYQIFINGHLGRKYLTSYKIGKT